jgi:hypothetical protein
MEAGYSETVAASIIRRLNQRGMVECGVSERTGWLTDKGRNTLAVSS